MRVESGFCLIEIRHLSINLATGSSGSDVLVPVSLVYSYHASTGFAFMLIPSSSC